MGPLRGLAAAFMCLGLGASGAWASDFESASRLRSPRGDAAVFTMARSLSLQSVGPRELGLDGRSSAASAGRWSHERLASVMDSGPERLTRRIPNAWTLRLPPDVRPGSFDVRLEVEAPDGTRGCLVSTDQPGSRLHVSARPLPPVVIDRDAEGITWSGAAILQLDLREATTAGSHRGRLVVTIEQF